MYKNIKTWKNHKIYEGEILTHNINKSINVIKNQLNKLNIIFDIEYQTDHYESNKYVLVFNVNDINQNVLNNLIKLLNNLGYYVSKTGFINKNNMSLNLFNEYQKDINKIISNFEEIKNNKEILKIYFIIEAKFDKNIKNEYAYLYHVCKKEDLDKILSIGLIPRSKNKISKHPDRVYLSYTENVLNLVQQLTEIDKKQELNRLNQLKSDIDLHNNHPSFIYSLLKIKTNSNIIFMQDPNYENGCFTYSNIKPEDIEYIKDIKAK